MSRLQKNQPDRIERILEAAQVLYQPRDLGLSLAEVEAAMLTLLAYVEAERLPYSIINARPMNAALVKEICHGLLFCIR